MGRHQSAGSRKEGAPGREAKGKKRAVAPREREVVRKKKKVGREGNITYLRKGEEMGAARRTLEPIVKKKKKTFAKEKKTFKL